MKPEIKFEDFAKLTLLIGEVKEIEPNLKINIGDRILEHENIDNVKEGDKIVVGFIKDKLVIPLINNFPIKPEKNIQPGSKVS
ncbi:hypothetical protein K9L16_01890 [Candidatus Pacearchaeota archaeon]|nr:hypothetical protein [Candidatus Pacearchaeota archaeon]